MKKTQCGRGLIFEKARVVILLNHAPINKDLSVGGLIHQTYDIKRYLTVKQGKIFF